MTSEEMVSFMMRQNLTVEEFADNLKVTEGAIRHWINNRRPIPGPVLLICRYCDDHNLSIQEFCGSDEEG